MFIDGTRSNNLIWFFCDFANIDVTFLDSGIIKTDIYYPPLSIEIILSLESTTQNCECSYRKSASADYYLLYNILSTYGWPCLYATVSADTTFATLNAIVQGAPQ
jgi:hypothetical protein